MNGEAIPAPLPTEQGSPGGRVFERLARGTRRVLTSLDFPLPGECQTDPELMRRARLISRFGTLGAIFGTLYALFYLLIGHRWGGLIIIVCSVCFGVTPFLMRRKQMIERAGHFLSCVLTLGFTALCFVEGGLQGHAIAWLVSVPLCALLMLGRRAAMRWAVLAFLTASVVATLAVAGIRLPLTYDQKWEPIVSATGYLGLIAFMFLLGLIFESGRARAFAKMQAALAELAKSNEHLVHLNQEKNEFLGIAAHDLKNPLTVIMGSAQMAGMMEDRREVNELLDGISKAAVRMRDLIANLLDVNAIEEGRFTSQVEPCDLGALVTQCVENNQAVATKKRILIRTEAAAGHWAKADPAATRQILDNLISNALKFSPPNTTVRVQTRVESCQVWVVVRDQGPGISAADQQKLFQKYSRLSARPTGGESSTGLGLAIVKRLAEAMAGTIQCESEPGAGAAFILRLPVCRPVGQ